MCRYPAELRSELYYPWYFAVPRPVINSVSNTGNITYGATFTAAVQLTGLGHGMSLLVNDVSANRS